MKVTRFTLLFALLAVGVLALVACGPPTPDAEDEATDPAATATTATAADESGESDPFLDVTPAGPALGESIIGDIEGDIQETDSGLRYVITEEGDGPSPEPGNAVRVHYTGMLEDGTVFDSSYDQGEPFQFGLGQGQVIPGWDEGIGLLKEGGAATLIIPPELGYGQQGRGSIPPNATLIFEVELVEVLEGAPEAPTAVDEADYTTTDSGLRYYDIEEGSGEEAVDGKPVALSFTVWLSDGTKVDSTLDRGDTYTYVLGSGQVFAGWDEGVHGMKVGGTRQLVIPPDLAFGAEGAGNGAIPPDATIVMEITLENVLEGSPENPVDVDEDAYTTTESGLKFYDVEEGDGASPEEGDTVSVHYTGWLTDGTKFDSSLDRGEPIQFVIGAGQVFDGWDEGMRTMKVGGTRQLVIPGDLALGEQGVPGTIPPNATLILEVELVEIQ